MPTNVPHLQLFPAEIINFVFASHKNFSLYRNYRKLPYNTWTPTWRLQFNEIDPEILLAHELSRSNLELRDSNIPRGGMGVFITTVSGAETVKFYYYGTLVYENLSICISNRPAVYVKGSLAVHVKFDTL